MTRIQNATLRLDERWFYQTGNASADVSALIDGNPATEFKASEAKLVTARNLIVGMIPLPLNFTVRSLRYYDSYGSFAEDPTIISFLERGTRRVVEAARMKGDKWKEWVEVKLPVPVPTDRLLINARGNWEYPTELVLTGDYDDVALSIPASDPVMTTVRNAAGLCVYYWNFMQDERNANVMGLNAAKMERLAIFGGIHRNFGVWSQLEPSKNEYGWSSTLGGWNHELMINSSHERGTPGVTALVQTPLYMQETYPAGTPNVHDIMPVLYQDIDKGLDPATYINGGRFWYNYFAYFGSNPNVDQTYLGLPWNRPWFHYRKQNEQKIALATAQYGEDGNEEDGDWQGRYAYTPVDKLGPKLSMAYDGHQYKYPGCGAKAADPKAKMTTPGTFFFHEDVIRGLHDYSVTHREPNPDGSVSYPFDVIQWHVYPNDKDLAQGQGSTRSTCPDMHPRYTRQAQRIVEARNMYAPGIPLWIGEIGGDLDSRSPLSFDATTQKTPGQVQACFFSRSLLFYLLHGMEKVCFYQAFDDTPGSPYRFMTAGAFEKSYPYEPRPAANVIQQLNAVIGDYSPRRILRHDKELFVGLFGLAHLSAYVCWVPDLADRAGVYPLDVPVGTVIRLVTLEYQGAAPTVRQICTRVSPYPIAVDELPRIVIV